MGSAEERRGVEGGGPSLFIYSHSAECRVWGKLASNKFKERLSFPIGDATKKIDAVPAAGHVTILYP